MSGQAPGRAPYTVHRGKEQSFGPYQTYAEALAKAESLSPPPAIIIIDADGNVVWTNP